MKNFLTDFLKIFHVKPLILSLLFFGATALPAWSQAVPITMGSTITGNIATTTEVDEYSFAATAGDKIYIPFSDNGGTTAWDPRLSLLNPSGTQVASVVGLVGNTLSYTVTVTGQYRITLRDEGSNATGNYSFTLQRTNNPVGGTAITYGSTHTGAAGYGEMDTYTFTAQANDKIYIPYSDNLGGGTWQPRLYLFNAAGTEVATTFADVGGTLSATVTTAGQYSLMIFDDGYNAYSGNYSFTLQRTNNPVGTAINFGSTNTGTATYGEMDTYTFTALANETITIPFDDQSGSSLWQPRLYLFDPSGTEVASAFAEVSGTLTATALTSGQYMLGILDDGYNSGGNYSFTIVENLISGVSVTPVFFDPLLPQTATIAWSLERESNITVKIYRATIDAAGTYQKTLIMTPMDAILKAPGQHSFVWDGKDAQGNILSPDAYIFTIYAASTTGGRTMLYDPNYVPGTVTIQNGTVSPSSFDPYKGEVATISYGLLVPSWVTLKVGVDAATTATRTIINNEPREVLNNTEYWDGRADNGNIIPATTYKVAGWTNLLPDNAVVIKKNLRIDSVTAQPYAFFPVYNQNTQIEYVLSGNSNVTVTILTSDGATVVRTLVNNVSQTAGTHSVIWDGRDTSGKVVRTAGNYRVRVSAMHPTVQNTVTREGNITVMEVK